MHIGSCTTGYICGQQCSFPPESLICCPLVETLKSMQRAQVIINPFTFSHQMKALKNSTRLLVEIRTKTTNDKRHIKQNKLTHGNRAVLFGGSSLALMTHHRSQTLGVCGTEFKELCDEMSQDNIIHCQFSSARFHRTAGWERRAIRAEISSIARNVCAWVWLVVGPTVYAESAR